MTAVPPSTNDIDEDWLTEVLKDSGQIVTEVTSVSTEPIAAGVGFMGELARLHLTYAGQEDLPETLVAKCAAQNENRQVARILDFYHREADFYNRVAPECPMNVPDSYHADVNPDTYDFVLLMEDLGNVSPPDQLVGATGEEVYSAIGNIAEMHAQWWGATASEHPWMYDMMSEAESERLRTLIYGPAVEPALEKFDYLFTPELKQVLLTLPISMRLSGPDTCCRSIPLFMVTTVRTTCFTLRTSRSHWSWTGRSAVAENRCLMSPTSCARALMLTCERRWSGMS